MQIEAIKGKPLQNGDKEKMCSDCDKGAAVAFRWNTAIRWSYLCETCFSQFINVAMKVRTEL